MAEPATRAKAKISVAPFFQSVLGVVNADFSVFRLIEISARELWIRSAQACARKGTLDELIRRRSGYSPESKHGDDACPSNVTLARRAFRAWSACPLQGIPGVIGEYGNVQIAGVEAVPRGGPFLGGGGPLAESPIGPHSSGAKIENRGCQ